ncbi:MAG TPA: antitoxin Xre/MbcA/ParS toxin-binding domain-containing protein [Kofleriaceae bacterium]|nr:antitoxin Xre/MbcA/ParS toxin-binding domain-containing protein [Kofleriaceae bacterium]
MASCAHCRAAKGKRDCPALGGSICPSCCGKHRLVTIACPSDCRWLGGLAVVRERAHAFTPDEYGRVTEKLFEFVRSPREQAACEEALELIHGGPEERSLPEWAVPVLLAYLAYGARDHDGRRAVDRFVAACARGLSAGEAAALGALSRARASLFEIDDVQRGIGLRLRDRIADGTFEVREVTATAQLRRGDVIFAWVMDVGDHRELTGASLVIPAVHYDVVEDALLEHLGDLRRDFPAIDAKDLVGAGADFVIDALVEAREAQPRPTLTRAARDDSPAPGDDDLPPELAHEVMLSMMRDHYRRWLDEPVPALGGKTPRKAARTIARRGRVVALIDGIEETMPELPAAALVALTNELRAELGLPLRALEGDGLVYDADHAPDPAAWLSAEELVRELAIGAHHDGLASHAPTPDRELHVSMHLIVENQIAGKEPPETAANVARLVADGLTRHDAIHAVASVISDEMRGVVHDGRAFDRDRVARALAQLRARDWPQRG